MRDGGGVGEAMCNVEARGQLCWSRPLSFHCYTAWEIELRLFGNFW